jgi:hypothetical protein
VHFEIYLENEWSIDLGKKTMEKRNRGGEKGEKRMNVIQQSAF